MHALKPRRLPVVAAVVAAVAVLAVVAYAFWSASGAGTGSGTTDNPGAQSVSVTQTSSNTGLYPGSSIALGGTISNNTTTPVKVASVTGTVTSVDATHAAAGCNAGDYSVTGTSSITGAGSVAGGGGTQSWSGLSLQMTNSASNQDACKGATVNVSYSAN